MTKVAILNYPNPRLHKKAELVTDIHAPEVQQMIDDMFETLAATPNCAGLAATQLDFAQPKFITVLNDYSEDGTQPLCLINAEIIEQKGEMHDEEGCLSVYPNEISMPVKRASYVKVRALDRKGKVIVYEAEGYVATLIQHEVDHLNGIVYVQRLSTLKRSRIENQIKKVIAKRKKPSSN